MNTYTLNLARNPDLVAEIVMSCDQLLTGAKEHTLWELAGALAAKYSLDDYGLLCTVAYLEAEYLWGQFLNRAPWPADTAGRPAVWNNTATVSTPHGMEHKREFLVGEGAHQQRITGKLDQLFGRLLLALIRERVRMHTQQAGYPAGLLPE